MIVLALKYMMPVNRAAGATRSRSITDRRKSPKRHWPSFVILYRTAVGGIEQKTGMNRERLS